MNSEPDSYINFLEHYGEMHPPRMRYGGEEDFLAWQRRFRETVMTLRGVLPERVKRSGQRARGAEHQGPAPEVMEETDAGDHTRFRMRLPVSEVSSPIVHLLVPKGIAAGEKRPGLVVYHGHESNIDAICGVGPPLHGADEAEHERRAYARLAVQEGYVVLALPLWGWTGRDGHVNAVGNRDKCNVIQMAGLMYGINPLALHLQDGEAALDYLASRDDVDADRLGCLGNSTGGRNTMWLAALDDRVAACVPSGCMNTFRERSLKLSSCGIQYFPGLLQFGDVTELFQLIAPRAMQLQAGEGDGLITPADRDTIERDVREVYRLLGEEGRFDYVLHEHGHLLEWEAARDFLGENLSTRRR